MWGLGGLKFLIGAGVTLLRLAACLAEPSGP